MFVNSAQTIAVLKKNMTYSMDIKLSAFFYKHQRLKLANPSSTTQISSHSSPGTGHTPRRPQEHAPQRKQGNMHLREEEVKRGVAGGSIEHN